MSAWIWAVVLLAAAWAAHWGAERLADPLKKLRKQFGFTQAAGAAIIGLAAASPEIGVNTTSAIRGVSDIGLGASLGSNVIAIPLIVTVTFIASRKRTLGGGDQEEHRRHLDEKLVRVTPRGITVQALPYLAIVAIFALLTLPKAWRGLDPIDGWILLAAYLVYATQALVRGRQQGESVQWGRKELWRAGLGLAALAVGAYFLVHATENIASALGMSRIVSGLFITAPVAALPEIFAVWSITRSGQVTSALTSVMGDHAVTMSLAFLPLALVGVPVERFTLFWVVLSFVAAMPIAFSALAYWGTPESGFRLWQVLALDAQAVVYVVVVLVGVLRIFS